MADFPGVLTDSVSLTEFVGASTARLLFLGRSTLAITGTAQPLVYELIDEANLPSLTLGTGGLFASGSPVALASVDYPGGLLAPGQIGDQWFEKILVSPQLIELGNVLSSQQTSIAVYNSFRSTAQSWVSFVNNVGAGISITNLPSLPAVLPAQDGFSLTVQVDADGAPNISGTLDFIFNLYTLFVTVTGQRVTVFPYPPESPLVENLKFLTDVMESRDGTEQRVKLRKNPRQEFTFNMKLTGDDRRAYDALMFDWQTSVFGVPLWAEATVLTAATSITDTVLTVQTTAYADYRVGGLAVVLTDRETFDALEIASFTATTITFTSGVNSVFPVGTLVMPMRTAVANESVGGKRALVNLESASILFRILDNDNLLSDLSAWNSFNSKVLLDDPNAADGGVSNKMLKRVYPQDGGTGKFSQDSPWARNKRITQKGFATSSHQEVWELRQLLHNLSGRRTSFYLPTFYDELKIFSAILIGTPTLEVENVGFVQFIQDRKGFIRVSYTDGTNEIKTVLSSAVVDADNETITLTTNWAAGHTVAQVDRIDYVETVRGDSDDVEIRHINGAGYAVARIPVKEVFSE